MRKETFSIEKIPEEYQSNDGRAKVLLPGLHTLGCFEHPQGRSFTISIKVGVMRSLIARKPRLGPRTRRGQKDRPNLLAADDISSREISSLNDISISVHLSLAVAVTVSVRLINQAGDGDPDGTQTEFKPSTIFDIYFSSRVTLNDTVIRQSVQSNLRSGSEFTDHEQRPPCTLFSRLNFIFRSSETHCYV